MNNKKNENLYKDSKQSINPDLINDQIKSRRSMFNTLELYGYKAANLVHRGATLTLIAFILGNIVFGIFAYNKYWKIRRQDMRRQQGLE